MRGVRPEYQEKKSTPPPPVATAFRPRETLGANRQVPIEQTLQESDAIFQQGDTSKWRAADARHFVGLYWRFHETVHGVEPMELRSKREWSQACVEAAMMLSRNFQGDREVMAHFISWTWAREHDAVNRRNSTWRTGWRQQFGLKLLTDYTAAMKRTRK